VELLECRCSSKALDADTENAGLNKTQLQADVELRLRKSGIHVLDKAFPTSPFLYVSLTSLKANEGPFYATNINVQFHRLGTFGKEPELSIYGAVWSKEMLRIQPSQNFRTATRDAIGELVDIFMNDYLAANPPKR